MDDSYENEAPTRASAVAGPRESFFNDMNQSFATNAKLQQAFNRVEDTTNELHQKLNVVYIALLGFVFIGLCALGCVVFGVVEIIGGDQVFENEGFGEVLTVLGTYFSIPYVFLIFLFVGLTVNNPVTKAAERLASAFSSQLLLSLVVLLYIFQASITNFYLVQLTNKFVLLITGLDIFVLVMMIYYHKRDGRGFIMFNLVFAIKAAIMWGPAYETKKREDFWGPNGILCMLFLCIPMCQYPLMISYVRPAVAVDAEGNPIDPRELDRRLLLEGQRLSMTSRGGSGLPVLPPPTPQSGSSGRNHLTTPSANANNKMNASVGSSNNGYNNYQTPSSPRSNYSEFNSPTNNDASYNGTSNRFTAISGRTVQKLQRAAEVGFMDHFVSHFSLYLNHIMHTIDLIVLFNFAFTEPTTTDIQREAPLPFRVLIAILFCAGFFTNHAALLHLFYNREDVQSANVPFLQPIIRAANRTVKTSGVSNPDADPKRSYQRRLFQYMLIMLAIVDIPLLICRLDLWAGQYAPLSIFVAKNIKDIVDVAMLTLRVNENLRAEGGEDQHNNNVGQLGSVPFGAMPPTQARENVA